MVQKQAVFSGARYAQAKIAPQTAEFGKVPCTCLEVYG